MKITVRIVSVILGVIIAFSMAACNSNGNNASENGQDNQGQVNTSSFKIKDPYEGSEINLSPLLFQEYLGLTDEQDIAKYLYENNSTVKGVASQKVAFFWESEIKGANNFTLLISDNIDFSNILYTKTTALDFTFVENLLPNLYYWKVKDNLGNETATDSFRVTDYVMALKTGSISNLRDLGGWHTEDGKTIKYGLSYRSAQLNAAGGAELATVLGLKTEIDLREGESYVTSMIPEQYNVNFLQAGIMQGDYVLPDKSFYSSLTAAQIKAKGHPDAAFKQTYADNLKKAFLMFTDESNYPILFHCTHGADRTGTFAFLLNGMLGVEIDDLYRDFELTSLVMGGKRWRSNIQVNDANDEYSFTNDGFVSITGNYIAIGLLYRGLMECYSTGDGKLSSAIKNYLTTVVGLTDDDINAIKNIMLA